MKEEFAEFVKAGMRMGVVPPFRVVKYSSRKGIVEFEDASGKRILGEKILVKGNLKWSFRIVSS